MKIHKEVLKRFFQNFHSNIGINLVKTLPAVVNTFGFRSAKVNYKNLLHIKDNIL